MATVRKLTLAEIAVLWAEERQRAAEVRRLREEVAVLQSRMVRLSVMLAGERAMVWRPRAARLLGISMSRYLREVDRLAEEGARHVEAARRERSA